jgi:hypothetical protein
VPEKLTSLFDEFATRYAAGEQPDAREYLERAGDGAGELARILDAFLQRAPAPEPDEEAVAMMGAWIAGEAPLVHLRASRGVRREQVVESVMRMLGLDPAKRTKVARYYHELENGFLSSARVDRRVLEAVAQALRTKVEDLLVWPQRPFQAEPAYLRLPTEAVEAAPPAAAALTREVEPGEYDEVDRLFGREPAA